MDIVNLSKQLASAEIDENEPDLIEILAKLANAGLIKRSEAKDGWQIAATGQAVLDMAGRDVQ
ncbi:MAG: hypothetical protein ABL907_24050 [Hyphomicrobium sp.]